MMQNKTILQTKNLVKRFGNLTAVRELSLEVREGEIFGFLGPNGAGKSTSINMMCGLLRPDSGQIFIKGKPVNTADPELRYHVGMCPQSIIVWSKLTCYEQLVFMAEMYGVKKTVARERALSLLNRMGLEAKKNKLASTLSGGMLRRLNIILALVHDPDIVVLDEPEAGLDPQSRVLVRDYIRSLARVKTVVLTTHNMDEAERMCDRVAIIDNGRLLELDTVDHLKQRNGAVNILEFAVNDDHLLQSTAVVLKKSGYPVSQAGSIFMISGKDILHKLPELLQALEQEGIKPSELKIRETSLEDIFISLTGRRLRE
jgi:ABC-2 type transport system ATP-binding protein